MESTINYGRMNDGGEAQNNKFNVSDYIPLRYPTKYLWYAASSILAVIVLIIILVVAFKTESGPSVNGKILFIVNNAKVMQYDLGTDTLTSQFEASMNSTVSAFEISRKNHSYWIEHFANGSQIVADMNGSRKVLMQEERFIPNGLAYDRYSENFYATDKNTGVLIALSLRNGFFSILLTDLIRPNDVVLDADEGVVFVLQHSHSIVRVNMDGSNASEISEKTGVTAFSIDATKKRVYWVNDSLSIESSDYEGKSRHLVFTSESAISDLIVSHDRLFWIETPVDTPILFSCKIDTEGNCTGRETHSFGVTGNAKFIRSGATVNATTPCQSSNGGCEQLCLTSGKNQSSCACRMGWELKPDNRTCQEVRDFLLYPHGELVRTCSLDGKREIFWPTPYIVKAIDVKTEIDFDYDVKNDYFYFTDDHHIHRMKLKSYAGQEIVLSLNNTDMIIEDIAYDWFTGNMYYGQRHVNATLEHSLMVFNLNLGEAYRKTLNIFEDHYYLARSYAMAVNPTRSALYVAVAREDSRDTDVNRFVINGAAASSSYHIYADGVHEHRFFAVDFTTDRVYEIQETGETVWIAYKSDEQSSMRLVGISNVSNARTISVYQQWLYLSNFSSIYRFDKDELGDGVLIAPRIVDSARKIVGVRIVSEDVQLTGSDNPCAKNNGDCEQFCFAGSEATCDCKDGQVVKDGGRCY